MPLLFISYRRSDSPDTVKLLHERLKRRLPRWEIFYDHESIPLGEQFPERLRAKVAAATVVLVIIGPKWLQILQERKNVAVDHVRAEVRLALELVRSIVPILVGHAKMPTDADLAGIAGLQPLLQRNGRPVRPDPDFDGDLEPIIAHLKQFDSDEAIGATLADKYTLTAEIGHGGMGVVYRAEQKHPVQRTVAVKLIKPGMDSRDVLARFAAEQQALAVMDHPHIAKVYDAGMTAQGRPFFVMEFVPGVPITQYCDDKKLSPQERLKLFIPVCNAVQHAHQKGILHRDLKPSNVLVEVVDGDPVAKVIDFGLAKALGQKLTDMSQLPTAVDMRIGTLEYSAPEQAAGRSFDMDTRSDIYSLGVLLYELLTGAPPFTRAELLKIGEEEMRRVIREDAPATPSKRLSSSGELPSIAAKRHLEPNKLTRLVQGDLDWIVMKCLEKEQVRRYETANQLGQELQRFLADEPVQAGPPSAAYRLKKFLRRNKGPVLAVGLVLLALIAGIIGTSIGLDQAERARDKAVQLSDKNGQLSREREVALERESRQRQRAEWQLYLFQMDKALLGLGEVRHDATQEMLERCRWDFRDWEYNYLSHEVNGARLLIEKAAAIITALAFSSDSGRIVAGCGNDVVVFDAQTGKRLFKGDGHTGQITTVACAFSAPLAVTAGKDRVARVWDLNRPGRSRTLSGHKAVITSAAVSADGKWAATGDATGTVIVWKPDTQLDTQQEVCRPAGLGSAVVGVAFLPGGEQLLSVDGSGKLLWHDLPSGKLAKQEELKVGLAQAVVSRDGRWLAIRYNEVGGSHVYIRETAGREWHSLSTPRPCKQMAFSPDGRWLARASEARVYFFNTATRVVDLLLHAHLRTNVNAFAFSPDGASVACGSDNWDKVATLPTAEVGVWDVADDLEQSLARESFDRSPKHPHLLPVDAAVSADGGTLVVGEAADVSVSQLTPAVARGVVHVWNFPQLGSHPRQSWTTQSRVLGVAVSRNGTCVATAHEDRAARLWDAATGKEIQTLRGHKSQVFAIAFGPDGQRLATGSGDGSVRLWDVRDGKLLRTLNASTHDIKAVGFSPPDGRLVASGGLDTFVRVWDAETGERVGEMRGHARAVTSLAFGPDGRLLVSGGGDDNTVRGWDVASASPLWVAKENVGRRIDVLGAGGDQRSVRKVLVTPSGRRVISLTGIHLLAGWNIRLWDAATGYQACPLSDDFHPLSMALSPDGQYLVGCGRDGGLKVWRAGEMPPFTPKVLKEQVLAISGCAFSPDGRLLACVSEDKSLAWYNLISGQKEGGVGLDGAGVCVAFHPLGKQIAHNHGDRTVAVRPLSDGAPARILEGHEDRVTALAYAPDGRLLATCGRDKTARLWEPETGKAVGVLRGHERTVSCLVFLSEGREVATGSWDMTVRIWDVASGEERLRLRAPGEGVTSLAVTPDDRYLVAGGLDGSLTVWNLAAGAALLKTWRDHPQAANHPQPVNAVALLPDGRTFASAGSDGTVRLWDVASAQPKAVIWVGGEGVLAVAVGSDEQLACGCKDGATRLFDLKKRHANRHAVRDD